MSNYLYISALNKTGKYECKTTHTGTPFLRVQEGYLDLTTKTTSNLKLKVEYNNTIYRPLQTYTTSSSTSASAISTMGYNGSLSRVSTSGYSGVSSQVSTSGYAGSLSRASTSGYSGRSTYTLSRTSSYGYTGYTTSSKSGTKAYTLVDYFTAVLKAVYPSSGVKTISYSLYDNKSTYKSATSNKTHNASIKVSWVGSNNLLSYATWSTTKSDGQMTKTFPKMSVSGGAWANYTFNVSVRGYYQTAKVSNANDTMSAWWSKGFKYLTYSHTHTGRPKTSTTTASGKGAASSAAVGALKSTTLLTRTSSYSASSYRTSAAAGVLKSTTALTKASYYWASSGAVGALSSATALTRVSNYNLTSSASEALSSATALTRISYYSTSSGDAGAMSSTAAITTVVSSSSSQSTITEI